MCLQYSVLAALRYRVVPRPLQQKNTLTATLRRVWQRVFPSAFSREY